MNIMNAHGRQRRRMKICALALATAGNSSGFSLHSGFTRSPAVKSSARWGGLDLISNSRYQCRAPSTKRNGLVMYFDDCSRNSLLYTTNWQPDDSFLQSIGHSTVDKEKEAKAVGEKLDALKRYLHGHDANSAAALDLQEVKDQVTNWAEKCGLAGDEIGDEVYEAIRGVHVCSSTTVSGCLAQFWDYILSVSKDVGQSEEGGSQLVMVVFPNCPDLYEYKTMSTMHAAVDFCSDICLHFGSEFSLTHFHPKYKNAPKMIHPTRHSPFPVLGLHFSGEYDEYVNRLSKKYGRDRKSKALADSEIPPTRDWVKERAATFEVLYNKAAASSSADILSRGTASRNVSQRFPKEEVVAMTENWMKKAKYKSASLSSSSHSPTSSSPPPFAGPAGSQEATNRALRYSDTIRDWNVVDAKVPEEVYAHVWKAIDELSRFGDMQEKVEAEGVVEKENTPSAKFNQMEWMKTLSSAFHSDRKGKDVSSHKVISTMFITTKFRAYNAEGFKRFAITVNAALKRLSGDKMFLEVFHPEYVGKKGYQSDLRRSPYPTLQICYEKGRSGIDGKGSDGQKKRAL